MKINLAGSQFEPFSLLFGLALVWIMVSVMTVVLALWVLLELVLRLVHLPTTLWRRARS